MKKVLLFVVLAALLTISSAFAQSGVQIINPQDNNSSNMDYLDDVKIGSEYEINDWGIIKPLSFHWWDRMNSDRKDDGSDSETELASLRINVINISHDKKNYISSNTTVKVIFDEDWIIDNCWKGQNDSSTKSDENAYLISNNESNWTAIQPFYEGSYSFVCKLPNYIVESEKALRMEITIDNLELIYHIRK